MMAMAAENKTAPEIAKSMGRHAIREVLGKPRGDGKGEPGLAHATGSGQRQQPDVQSVEALNEQRDLSLPAKDRRDREG